MFQYLQYIAGILPQEKVFTFVDITCCMYEYMQLMKKRDEE
jgi:hypothetical protein